MPAFVLRHHAAYRCRHSGACCTSGWPIPVEGSRAIEIRRALGSGRLRLESAAGPDAALEVPPGLPPGVGAVTTCRAGGRCAFHERGSGLCAIHRQLGPALLPVSCAHFPRVCLVDEDATYVTLSHYCPTVAGLLFVETVEGRGARVEGNEAAHAAEGRASSVVAAPPGLLAGLEVEGLDARGQLPPLLCPGMLADRRSYRLWERLIVEELAAGQGNLESRLRRAEALTERVCAWRPSTGLALEVHVRQCAAELPAAPGGERRGFAPRTGALRERQGQPCHTPADRAAALFDLVRSACPPGLAPAPSPPGLARQLAHWVDPAWDSWSPVAGRYLAAKVFGSWLAYQADGLHAVLAGAFAALAVLRVEAARACAEAGRPLDAALLKEAVRQADLLLVHLASREALASALAGRAE